VEAFVQDGCVAALFGIGLGAVAAVAATSGDQYKRREDEGQKAGDAAEAAPPAIATC
jgi:hypothetical protein